MKRSLFIALAVGLGLTANLWAQVPSYVPTNGLVGYWPFNGNANDESGNGNNGTVNGATLTTDRFGNSGKAYSFDGNSDIIEVSSTALLEFQHFTISCWFNTNQSNGFQSLISKSNWNNSENEKFILWFDENDIRFDVKMNSNCTSGVGWQNFSTNKTINFHDNWQQLVISFQGTSIKIYLENKLLNEVLFAGPIDYCLGGQLKFGSWWSGDPQWYNGKLDDIGIWNRALSQQEITALYNGCGNEISSQPVNANINSGSNAQFSINSISGSSCQWQSNPLNMGWQNITNNSSYSGATSNTLSVSNTAVSNHNQPFRAIVNAGTCIDTSDIAQIIIGDTCLSTTYDTIVTTVTDTLIINTTLSLPSPNNENTIKIYPNPTSDHITIDNGNYTAMLGYSIKITNNAGQQVFQNSISQAQFNVDLSTWSGNGLYFVHLIDSQNNTVTIRKIVLQ